MYINFQQNQVSRSAKNVHTNLFAKNCKLHKFATCNENFEKSGLSDMHYPLTDIQADFEIKWPTRYQITAKRNYLHRRQTDRQTDRSTHRRTRRTTTIGSFSKKEKTTKNQLAAQNINYVYVYNLDIQQCQSTKHTVQDFIKITIILLELFSSL